MAGEITLRIVGDANDYEKALAKAKEQNEQTKQQTINTINETQTLINATEKDSYAVAHQTEIDMLKAQVSIHNTLFVLRSITDSFALLSAMSGEQIDVSFITLTTMALSSMLQIKAQAALFMATPGMQPLAMMMLALIPMFTGLITYFKAEQMKAQQRNEQMNTQQLDKILDGIPY